jgi:hypothetical protein
LAQASWSEGFCIGDGSDLLWNLSNGTRYPWFAKG